MSRKLQTLLKINPEIIFHLAAQPLVSEAYKILYTFETNVIGTINLLDSCKNLKTSSQ